MTTPAPPPQPPRPTRAVWLALLGLIALRAGLSADWIARDQQPRGQEVVNHLLIVAELRAALFDGAASWDHALAWASANRRRGVRSTVPHLGFALLASGAPPAARDRLLTATLGGLTLLALALGTYAWARRELEPWGALLAVALLLSAPGVWGTLRVFAFDLPLAGGLALLGATLARLPCWSSRGAAFGVGVLAGACCLIKGQAVLWVPWLALPAWWAAGARLDRLLAFLAGAALGSAPFWYGELAGLRQLADSHLREGGHPRGPLDIALDAYGPVGRLLFYPLSSPAWQGLALTALGLLGAGQALRRRSAGDRQLLVFVIASGLLFSLIEVRMGRYLLPIMPALAILAAGWVTRRRRAGLIAALALAVAGLHELACTRQPGPPLWMASSYSEPPLASNWPARVEQLRVELERLGPAAPTIDRLHVETDTAEVVPDDLARLALRLRRRYPLARIEIDSPTSERASGPVRPAVTLVIHRRGTRPEPPWGEASRYRRRYLGELRPAGDVPTAPRGLTAFIRR